jgi:hypothetical protein
MNRKCIKFPEGNSFCMDFVWFRILLKSIWALALGPNRVFSRGGLFVYSGYNFPRPRFLPAAPTQLHGDRNNGIPACIWPLDNERATVSLSCDFFCCPKTCGEQSAPFFSSVARMKKFNKRDTAASVPEFRAAIIAALTFNITVEIISSARRH